MIRLRLHRRVPAVQEPQVILTLPLLEGTSGDGEKMSKSLGNTIGIMEPAGDIFGKTMSIPDSLLPNYLRLCTDFSREERDADIAAFERGEGNPVHLKRKLARHLVDLYCGSGEGQKAEAAFDQVFVKRDLPDDMPEAEFSLGGDPVWIVGLMREKGLAKSAGEARRLISQGAVSLDGEKVESPDMEISLDRVGEKVLKVGKRRFFKIIVRQTVYPFQ